MLYIITKQLVYGPRKCSALSQGHSLALTTSTNWGDPSPPITLQYLSKPLPPLEPSAESTSSTKLSLTHPPPIRHDLTSFRKLTALSLYFVFATSYFELVICTCGLIPFVRLEAPGRVIKSSTFLY